MRERPLCAAAVFFLCVQAVLVGVFGCAPDLKVTELEALVCGQTKSEAAPDADESDGEAAVQLEEGKVILLGTVYRREKKPNSEIFYLKDSQVLFGMQSCQESKILVYVKVDSKKIPKSSEIGKTEEQIAVGNRIRVSGDAAAFEAARNPGNFDQKFYYQKQGIHVVVYADFVEIKSNRTYPVRERLAVLREQWKELLVECLGEEYGNSMSAILLGDKSELDGELKTLYQKSGIGHILAISGLHMSFLGMGVYKLLRKVGMPFWPAGSIGILFLALYTLMIGAGVSSLRALVMFVVRMGAEIAGRDYDMPTSLALAGAVIGAYQPLYLLDAGFLLSFGALLGLTAVQPALENSLGSFGETVLGKSLCGSLAVNLTLLPVMLYFYFEFPLYSTVLNLAVIPLMSVVLGAGAVGSVLAAAGAVWQGMAAVNFLWPIGKLGNLVLLVCKGVLWFYEWACRISMQLPLGRIVTGQPKKVGIAVYYACLLVFCIWKRKKKFLVLVMVIVLAVSCLAETGLPGQMKIVMVDVGQGDGIYIKGPEGRRYFVDGGSSDVSSVGKYRIEPFLLSQGVRSLDYVFISHGDADHMSGIGEMLVNQQLGIRTQNLVLPPERVWDEALEELAVLAAENGTRVVTMEAGDVLTEGTKDKILTLTCLAPSREYQGESGNAASMVLDLSFGEFDMLLTGDLEGEGEENLSKNVTLRQYDVLKAAHHGSKNSTSGAFLTCVSPKMAWISAGVNNRYGHPHAETLERLRAAGSQVFCTLESGAVTLMTDGKRIRMEEFVSR